MGNFLFFLILIFVTINIVQTWLILTYPGGSRREKGGLVLFNHKLLIKGGIIIGAMEAVELPLIIYLIIEGRVIGFGVVVSIEIIQWSLIAYFSTKSSSR
jgi:hypothetical protein